MDQANTNSNQKGDNNNASEAGLTSPVCPMY